jgi:long-chain acyl-CoA synthetase
MAPEDTSSSPSPLNVAETLRGKNICLIGATGFVGKVALSMFLHRYPELGKLFVVVRPGAGNSAEDRFFTKIVNSKPFEPVRQRYGKEFMDLLRDKVVPLPGDVGRPFCNFPDEQFEAFERVGGLDVMVNSAGLVTFTPSLESAIRINVTGAKSALDTARRAGAALLHVSTCFVAGRRDGTIWENEPIVGYFPRHDELLDDDFDAVAEVEDCNRIIEQVRVRANDRAHISEFRELAAAQLREEGRDPDDASNLRLAVARQRKIWIHTRLTELGMERARYWGWTNTYTYTKSLGEQVILREAMQPGGVRTAIVRPAVVESALRYPLPGWNEGFNTTAPLSYIALKGHRTLVASDKGALDIIPVDHVAAGMIGVTAALIDGSSDVVYQLGTSGVNPVRTRRLGELMGLANRRHYRAKAKAGEDKLASYARARLEVNVVSPATFRRVSAPQIRRLADATSKAIERYVPTWGAPHLQAYAERWQEELSKVSSFTGQVEQMIELFLPFTHDHEIYFRSDNMKKLFDRFTAADKQRLPWDIEAIDWRHYWMDVHFPGLQEHVFPVLDDEFGPKPPSVYTYKDLLELFTATCKLHKHRTAFRLLRTQEGETEPDVYSYGRVFDLAQVVAAQLRERGVEGGDRVMILSENRPAWAIVYFGILMAGATAVPLDAQLSMAEVANLARASGAKVLAISPKQARRLADAADAALPFDAPAEPSALSQVAQAVPGPVLVEIQALLDEPAMAPGAVLASRRGDSLASIIYTSGTTGTPKGVMLTDKNLTAMVSKLASVFRLYKHDGLLSVLPLHHTFEFTVGLLMPLMRGAQITYLDDLNADALNQAFEDGTVTGLVGVPALWQALHRKIHKPFADRGPLVERAFETIVELNRQLREKAPYGINVGRLLFFPVHGALGGRMRLLISGGSALPDDVNKLFQGLGFKLYEGYGMTESSPVLTVQRPGDSSPIGSVGRPLPGVDVEIHEPDERGVGEVIAKGANVMQGYYENDEATRFTLRDGWLHTGDLGRIDEDGNLYIVGRKKEMILGAAGENVYPDELEELYGDSTYVKELSIVGVPQPGGGETVACLAVPDYEAEPALARAEVRDRVREHVKNVSARLPVYKRVKILHLWDHELPKTSTRKVKRREVTRELERLERAVEGARGDSGKAVKHSDDDWVLDLVAQVCQRPRKDVHLDARLDGLGFDSLMYTELGVALEAAGVELADASELHALETVDDLRRFVAAKPRVARVKKLSRVRVEDHTLDAEAIKLPEPLVRAGRRALRLGQRALYERVYDARVLGKSFVPPFGGYIVVANHASHLDMGLVKHALGEQGEHLVALAAKDYFFDDPVRRAYFENFTNLVPMERHGSLRESLRLASDVIQQGYILLIFPEGTRSETGIMTDFKPSIGFLAMHNRCGILPMYLAGTHDAMPKGRLLPKRDQEIEAHVGPFIEFDALRALADGRSRADAYRVIAAHTERIVRRLAPESQVWTLGQAGRSALADQQEVEP